MTSPSTHPRPAIGVVCFRYDQSGADQVLLIRRGRPPRQGQWSIPGGKVEWGETVKACAKRELFEETGIHAEIGDLIEVYEIIEPDYHYVLIDYAAQWVSGEPKAADDADEARFVTRAEALALVSQPDLVDVITRAFEAHASNVNV